jgi:hypothetical protein
MPNEQNDKKDVNGSTLLLWMVLSGGGVGGLTGFLSGGTTSAIDNHDHIRAEHVEIWREIRMMKDQLAELKARVNQNTMR